MSVGSVPVDTGSAERDNFVTDIGFTELLLTEERCLTVAPLSETICPHPGTPSLGVLMTLFDCGASHPALIAGRPDWTATQDISLHGADPITTGPVVVDSRLVRAGKKVVIVSTSIRDGMGEHDPGRLGRAIDEAERSGDAAAVPLAAAGLVAFARLPRAAAPGTDDYDPGRWLGTVRHTGEPAPEAAGGLRRRLGLRLLDDRTGHVELDRTPYVTNSIGTILGGVQAIMIEAAAEAMRPGTVATDMQIHYLAQVRSGPARTTGAVLRDAADHSVVTVRLTDAGEDDHVLALATVTLRPAGREIR